MLPEFQLNESSILDTDPNFKILMGYKKTSLQIKLNGLGYTSIGKSKTQLAKSIAVIENEKFFIDWKKLLNGRS